VPRKSIFRVRRFKMLVEQAIRLLGRWQAIRLPHQQYVN
jgi:hypothetical protein